jgi:NitT/TauT family transport system permease protein
LGDQTTSLPLVDGDRVGAEIADTEGVLLKDRVVLDTSRAARVKAKVVFEMGAPPLAAFILVIALWQYAVPALGINSNTLPTPLEIWNTFVAVHAAVVSDGWFTFWNEALRGYVAGSAIGFLVAVLAWRFAPVARGLLPYGVISNSIPIVAMAPVAIVLFGLDWQSKAVICAVMCVFPMLVNTYRGLCSVDPLSSELISSYAAGKWTAFWKLRLPAALPFIFNGLKINTTLAMIAAIIGEYFGSLSQGLGSYINNQSGINNYVETWAAVVVACIVGIAFYLLVLLIERRLTHWHVSYRSDR